jgi:hypothetical protein
LAFSVSAESGQTTAGVSTHEKQVEQGKEIVVVITLTPTPTVRGSVWIHLSSESEPDKYVQGQNGIQPGQASVEMGAMIPIDAEPGPWKVVGVWFEPPNSEQKKLTLTDKVSFQVVKREVVLPQTATVQVK